MSTRLAVICEDPTYDQYLVRPVLRSLLARLSKPKAAIQVVDNPRARGDVQVMGRACEFVERYSAIADAIIFVLDQDCEDGQGGRPDKRVRLENAIADCKEGREKVVTLLAVQEVEVWALWGARGDIPDTWGAVRSECHPKEVYFNPRLVDSDALRADGGRARLIGASLASGWASLASGCPELLRLEAELRAVIAA
jgi:hypothetical protein